MTLLTGQIIPRQDTAANWTSANPVLGSFEQGFETDTGLSKRGDDATAWNDLEYEGGTSSTESRLLSGGAITVVGDDITIATCQYFLEGEGTFTAPETAFNNIALSASGLQRFVAFYGQDDSTLVKVEGTEGAVASLPATPAGTVLINYSLVTDGAVGSSPDLSAYLLRADKATTSEVRAGTNDTKYITPLALLGADLPINVIWKRNTATSAHTGTLTETVIDSFLIPAGTISANDFLRIVCFPVTPFASGVTKHFRVKLNTVNNLTGSPVQAALYTFTSSSQRFERTICFRNSLASQEVTVATTSHATDASVIVASSDFTSLTVNFAVDIYVLLTAELTNISNSMTLKHGFATIAR